MMKTNLPQKRDFRDRLLVFLTSFWGQLGVQEGAKNEKKKLQKGSKKRVEKNKSRLNGTQVKKSKKRSSIYAYI